MTEQNNLVVTCCSLKSARSIKTNHTQFPVVEADLQLVDTFMVGGEYADIYRMRLHNTSSTVTLFSETFEMITLVTESSVMGSKCMSLNQISKLKTVKTLKMR